MKFLYYLLLIAAATTIMLPARAQDWDLEGPHRGQSLVFDVIYHADVSRAEFNQRNLNWIEISPDPPPSSAGAFSIALADQNARTLYAGQINLRPGRNKVVVPYFLNISFITLKNSSGEVLLRSASGELATANACNENNHCDAGEETLCPLDCPTAKNPSYPRPPGAPTVSIPQPSPPPAAITPAASLQQFRFGLAAAGGGLFILVLIAVIIFGRRR